MSLLSGKVNRPDTLWSPVSQKVNSKDCKEPCHEKLSGHSLGRSLGARSSRPDARSVPDTVPSCPAGAAVLPLAIGCRKAQASPTGNWWRFLLVLVGSRAPSTLRRLDAGARSPTSRAMAHGLCLRRLLDTCLSTDVAQCTFSTSSQRSRSSRTRR